MHDPHQILNAAADTVARLKRRGYRLDLPGLAKLVDERKQAVARGDALRTELNSTTRQLRAAPNGHRETLVASARALKEEIRLADAARRQYEEELRRLLLTIPNLPLDEVPDGGPQDPPVEVRRWGLRPDADFPPRDHVELATAAGLLDPERAAKLSGSRFAVLRGAAAALERALTAFLLDMHTKEFGYTEYSLPHLVTEQTMTGTGQLPKFEDDLFRTEVADRRLYLIPTAEVPLVNLYRGEVLAPADLPLALTAHTACYRSEAGSYGRDTRGLVRLHQFSKVELVRLCAREEAPQQLELMLRHAEECLRRLGLHYRVVQLRAADLGFSARRTFDLEVWLPGQDCFREISSVSDCGSFQARRAEITVRRGGRKEYVATLNGSGLPIGRTLVAILEQYQQADGSVTIPPALAPYAGFHEISPAGRTPALR
ncbi:MAG TPA: serine--tRNA ligase [Actinocrinis sp.]|jgi:seryl-tRNA synthetase